MQLSKAFLWLSVLVIPAFGFLQLLGSNSSTTDQHQLASTHFGKDIIGLTRAQKTVEFETIEHAIDRIEMAGSDELMVDAQLESILRQASAPFLEQPLHPDTIERIQFLIQKRLSGEKGAALAELYALYYRYKIAEQTEIVESGINRIDNLDDEVARFELSLALQKEMLGETLSNQLFGDQNRLAGYLFGRRKIANDPDLTEREKVRQTQALQEAFTQSGKIQ